MQSYVISENNALLSELCAGARNVASDVTAVVFGDGAAAAECGADHILTCPLEESGSPEDFAKAIAEEILKSDAAYKASFLRKATKASTASSLSPSIIS